jgi:tRNA isopentenyl-2-thiomethyl-A-37 hydroxylase MiaE
MDAREDDRIIREMLAPRVDESLEALAYWLRRHERLPFYRRRARSEARRMIDFWRARSLADASRDPLAALVNARTLARVGTRLVSYQATRIVRRAGLAAVLVVALVAVVAVH